MSTDSAWSEVVVVLTDVNWEKDMGTPAEFAEVLELSKFPNVFMKLSGLNHFATDPPLYKSAIPLTKRIIAEFGPARMVWGSGSPDIVDVHMDGYSAAEIALVKGGNLMRLIDWGDNSTTQNKSRL